MKVKKKVVAAGHACLDITPVFPRSGGCRRIGDVLVPGRLIQMEGVSISSGGAVSNTGLAMRLLGAEVCLMAKTGMDEFGKILADIYRKYGAADGIIAVQGERTSYSAVIAVPGTDRIFLHDPGCNDTFTFADIDQKKLEDAVLFHFGYPPIMKKMYERGGEELEIMMKYMKEHGIATSMDMAAVDADSEAGRADWEAILERVLPYVDFFVPSVEELCFMLDRPRYESWQKRADGGDPVEFLDSETDVRPLAERCIALGAKMVLIKCGAPGLYYKTADAGQLGDLAAITGIDPVNWGAKEGFERSYVPDQVLSGTGAGDTTIAAFLCAMLEGYPFLRCIQMAAAQGASCVASYGALDGICSLEELNTRIERGWAKRGE